MRKYDFAVFIGRLQPPHVEHINEINRALDLADKVIVALGSHRSAPNIKNPWTTTEREQMVRSCFSQEFNARLSFVSVRDYYYNDTAWFTNLHNAVNSVIDKENAKICAVGCAKDTSSWYLEALPENWTREIKCKSSSTVNSTRLRLQYFKDCEDIENEDLFPSVKEFLNNWSSNPLYFKLSAEYKFIQDYKESWKQAPYPVTFVTTDAIVIKNGHVLVVRRKFNPGKGLLALPGGFVNQGEKIEDSAIRELKEETRILMPKDILLKNIVDSHVFDHPDRSLRGRTITHAFCIKLPDGGQLPQVKGDDDAERAMWIPIADLFVLENEFYEDHCHIIEYFVRKF